MTSILWQIASLYSARSRSFNSYYSKLYMLIGHAAKPKIARPIDQDAYILPRPIFPYYSKFRHFITDVSKLDPFVNVCTYINIENLACNEYFQSKIRLEPDFI